MRFRSVILAVALSIGLMAPALALDISGLTDAQVADLQAKAYAIKSDNLNKTGPAPVSTAQTISEYAQLGKDLGVGLASTARELGIAANQFADTPVGHIAMALIIYKVIGDSIIHLVCGFLWLTAATCLFIYFFRRLYMYDSVETKYDPTTGKRTGVVRKAMNPKDGDVQAGRLIMGAGMAVAAVVGLIITFTG